MAKKIKTLICAAVLGLAALVGGILLVPVHANAATLSATEFKTNGSSVRVFEKDHTGAYLETNRKGLRFHVEMGSGYAYNGTTLLDTSAQNDRGSWKMTDGFKTYTLVLPTRLLSGDLTVETDKVLKIDTSGYWYTDGDGNWESVAYVYNIPAARYTDTFSFRGVVCTVDENGTETVVVSTEISERRLVEVAKQAYKDTIADGDYWGSAEMDETAAPLLKAFVPTYSISYTVGATTPTTEEVLWGDVPQSVPSFDIVEDEYIEKKATWYDTTNNEEVDITKAMEWTENRTLTLTNATSAEFVLTGVADYNNFTVESTLYSGAKIYATLPATDFYTADEIVNGTSKFVPVDAKAVNIEYEGTGTFTGLQGVWTLLEGKGSDCENSNFGAQVRLVFAFDSSTLVSGDKLIIKADSVFYTNNIMYKLTEEYTIDYTVNEGKEDYGIFLGYLYNSDIKSIESWIEPTDTTRKRIRVTFYDDLLVNSDFEFIFDGAMPDGYTYPVYTKCNETGTVTEITQGHYYWNEGQNTILELEGYEEHDADELYGVPGIKIVQNGGYYIFEDAMYAYLVDDDWVVGKEKGTFGANAFENKGHNETAGTQEVRFTTNSNTALTAGGTTNRWFDEVYYLTAENMSETEPYAVYATAPDGTVTEIEEFIYHGQSYETNDGTTTYNHIFALKNYIGTEAGETVTIISGTRFWYGSDYFTATEKIVFYYNGECWITNHNGEADYTATADNFTGKNYNFYEVGVNKLRMHFTSELFGGVTSPLYVESGSVKVNDVAYTELYYHGNGNMILEIIGGTETAIGSTPFVDTLVIEAGTRLWCGIPSGQTSTPYCLEFTEALEWRYVGESLTDGSGNPLKYEWVIPNNTNITRADVIKMSNNTDADGEVRLTLASGILTNSFYGYMAVDTSKGIPVVNGVEKANYSFAYGQANNLIAVRGGEYGRNLGDYIIIPAGSVWWTTQGSLTFTEEIFGAFNGGEWFVGFNAEDKLNEVSQSNIQEVYNDGSNEVRIKIPLGINDTYYGAVAIEGEAYVTKVDGTVVNTVFSYWYGGASGTYTANHSLIGLRGTGIGGSSNGDVLTIKAGTRIAFQASNSGYCEIVDDLVYTYVDGAWKAGNLNGSATYNGSNATVTGDEKVIIGKTYTFTVTPNSGYAVSEVTVNGTPLALNNNNVYTFTAAATNEIVVSTISTASAYKVTFAVSAGVTVEGGAYGDGSEVYVVSGESLTFSVEVASGYRFVGVEGAVDNGDNTYTVTPTDSTTVTITAVKQWTVTYTLNESTALIYGQTVTSGSSMTVDEGTYVVTVTANSGYAITGITNATNNLDGTYTVVVDSNKAVVVNTMQSIQLDSSAITEINPYDETQYGADLTGIRFVMNASEFSSITAVHYGLSWNGSVTTTVDGGVYYATAFGEHNLFELRFHTANLVAGDTFTIKAGTVFSGGNGGGTPYAIEWSEDIVGVWAGTSWILNPTKAGDLDWNKVGNVMSYSDYVNGSAINYTIRIFLSEELFGGVSGQGAAIGNVTVNGSAYTGIWRYHGNGNKIVELSEWNYASGDVLVIEAGTKIFLGSSYYVTTNTLTATCQADGSGAQWTFTVS